MSKDELACAYAAVILQDGGVEVTSEALEALLKASKVTVEPYWPSLFAKMAATKDLDELVLLQNASSGPGAAAGGADAEGEAAAAEEEEEEEEEEVDANVGGLFGDDDDGY